MFFLCQAIFSKAQTADEIIQKVKMKLEKVNNYQASGKMKTNVAFIKAPVAIVTIYYKKPDQLRIVNENGISFIPKGSMNINLNSILFNTKDFDVIDAGKGSDGLRVIKLLPKSDTSSIVLSTIYVDEKNLLIAKSKTTTKENGTYEVAMSYGKYSEYGLPDKIVFSFNTKDYKLPKGITLDYDEGSGKNEERLKNKTGTVEITYTRYIINKG
jgi:outer membrane lipoprotein-sorting protein